MTWRIPLSDISFGPEEMQAVQEVLQSGWLTMGNVTQDFETAFAQYTGAKYALAVTNCTAGLHMACLAVGLKPGDEAIVPALTFVATANAVRYTGATPVFADITSENNLNISVESIEACITERTRAIIVVHYGGYACDMPRIMDLAHKHGLKVIEDAAHAAGAWLDERHLGTWGDIGCYSFFSNKNMTTGEGGMVTTNDDALREKLRLLRSHGMTSLTWDRHKGHAWSYDVVELGYNYRIDEIRAALGNAQLKKLDGFNARRRELVKCYRDALQELVPDVVVPFEAHPGVTAAHIMPILLPEGVERRVFMERMKTEGIQTSIHYPPIHHFSAYSPQYAYLELPLTDSVVKREVTLPLYPKLSEDDVLSVVQAVKASL
ncbi:MAG: DegT/DnrJ/EryC1/StrS family aminotransferase [Anaerolineales bacterium]